MEMNLFNQYFTLGAMALCAALILVSLYYLVKRHWDDVKDFLLYAGVIIVVIAGFIGASIGFGLLLHEVLRVPFIH